MVPGGTNVGNQAVNDIFRATQKDRFVTSQNRKVAEAFGNLDRGLQLGTEIRAHDIGVARKSPCLGLDRGIHPRRFLPPTTWQLPPPEYQKKEHSGPWQKEDQHQPRHRSVWLAATSHDRNHDESNNPLTNRKCEIPGHVTSSFPLYQAGCRVLLLLRRHIRPASVRIRVTRNPLPLAIRNGSKITTVSSVPIAPATGTKGLRKSFLSRSSVHRVMRISARCTRNCAAVPPEPCSQVPPAHSRTCSEWSAYNTRCSAPTLLPRVADTRWSLPLPVRDKSWSYRNRQSWPDSMLWWWAHNRSLSAALDMPSLPARNMLPWGPWHCMFHNCSLVQEYNRSVALPAVEPRRPLVPDKAPTTSTRDWK